jgi:hypothetical protein
MKINHHTSGMGLWLLLTANLLITTGCQQEGENTRELLASSNQQERDTESDKEEVTPPSNVTGSYLNCSAILTDENGEPTNRAGCRVVDAASGQVVDIYQVATTVEWNFVKGQNSNIEATIEPQPANSPWHAIYTFETPPGEKPVLGDNSSQITVTLSGIYGQSESITLERDIDRLILDYIDSRIIDVFMPVVQ